jgi:hypothetical protein
MEKILKKIDFGNETADDADMQELLSYFVEQQYFQHFIDPKFRFRIATARKGVGKSALNRWAAHAVSQREPDALVISCRGADLSGIRTPFESELRSPNDYIRNWMIKICALANRHLASRLNIALKDDSITLIETAELDGFRSKNFIGCLIDRLNTLLPGKSITKKAASDEVALFRRSKRPPLWLFVDDLDATFQNTLKENIEIGTFFSACRYLSRDIGEVYLRATMRTDVWAIVRRYDESLDKVEQYVHEITWPINEFKKLLYMRIKGQCDKFGINPIPRGEMLSDYKKQGLYLDLVFVPRMTWGNKEQETFRIIHTLSYERPRWAIQLCKLAKETAIADRQDRILKANIDEVWGEYGAKRIKDLVAEHKHQCPQIEELLNGFRGCERLLTRDALFKWINNRILQHMRPTIEGDIVNNPRNVAHFLYRVGFLIARSEQDTESYEHYHHSEMPDFLTARTDEDFNVKWEIHPCYREALDIKKLDQSHRRGFRKRRNSY